MDLKCLDTYSQRIQGAVLVKVGLPVGLVVAEPTPKANHMGPTRLLQLLAGSVLVQTARAGTSYWEKMRSSFKFTSGNRPANPANNTMV
jgi:hypothetical protein